jgi:hypothetical protein
VTSVHVHCSACAGLGYLFPAEGWQLCADCDGVGYVWAPGAPGYGCTRTLEGQARGSIVTLGNGERGRVVSGPKAQGVVRLLLIDDFTDAEARYPTTYPSCVGVMGVGIPAMPGDERDHSRARRADPGDPMHRSMLNLQAQGK